MGQRVAFSGEVNRIGEPEGNRVLTVRQSRWEQTRNLMI